ncbi:unnamed protein product, partial [marine sediment metagenome]
MISDKRTRLLYILLAIVVLTIIIDSCGKNRKEAEQTEEPPPV